MKILFYTLLSVLLASNLFSQSFVLDANVELTAAKFLPDNIPQRRINTNFRNDDPFNAVRIKLFPRLIFNETFSIEGDFLFDNKMHKINKPKEKEYLRADGLFLSVRNLFDNKINFWIGKVFSPVGQFTHRSYSHQNPLIGFPLAYHYKVPFSGYKAFDETTSLFFRDNMLPGVTTIYEACWMTGVTAFGIWNNVEYTAFAGKGGLSNPEPKEDGGLQYAGRIGYVSENFRFGVSYGIAPYLEHRGEKLPLGMDASEPKHKLLGLDANLYNETWKVFLEVFLNTFDTPQYQKEKSIQAYTWFIEGQYFLFDNFYTAFRFDQMLYSDITNPVTKAKTPWGYDVTRIEAGVGYSPFRELNIKAVLQNNSLAFPTTKRITILALQTTFRFENIQQYF
ncbi:MAG: hypothetical protein KG003_14210 [Bacteroidetes bacterium]|nr:hypothetical protein [Bacteroidota bacterium]